LGGAGALKKTGAGVLVLPNVRLAGWTQDGGTTRIVPNGTAAGTSKIASLSMSPNTVLDLGDNDLIVDGANFSHYADLVALIKSARANGTWFGPGITSSNAAASGGVTALGIAKASDFFISFPATFSGQTIGATDVLIKYTYNGDTDLNGKVNFDDYVRTDNGFNNHLGGWTNGDFDYNGTVNFDDYVLIDLAFNAQNGTLGRALSFLGGSDTSGADMNDPALQRVEQHVAQFGDAYARSFIIAVPEPTAAVAACGVAVLAGTGSRRRRR
jgi:hypothetical protein